MSELLLPPDITPEEIGILTFTTLDLYRHIDDPIDKLIIIMVYQLGYGKQETAYAIGVTYETVYKRDLNIKKKLAEVYKIKV